MILWQLAGTIFLFRWIFRDPKVDVRLLAAGALLPDLIDLVLGIFLGQPSRQRIGHALVAPTVVAIVVLLSTRRGRLRRRLMTVVVAWMFHLMLDLVWLREETFLWPFFGIDFAPWPQGPIMGRALSDPWRWAKEAVGLAYLLGRWRSFRPQLQRG
jgi:hypothetical protein